MDDIATTFLSLPSYRTIELGLKPFVYPVELPTTKNIDHVNRLRSYVTNRLWKDVHILCDQLLYGSISSHVAPIYAALLSNNDDTDELGLDSHKRELVYVMTVYVKALIKLKYFPKLQALISSWTFCHHHISVGGKMNNAYDWNDRTTEHRSPGSKAVDNRSKKKPPQWIPWNLHIVAICSLYYTVSPNIAVDELWKIRATIQQQLKQYQQQHPSSNDQQQMTHYSRTDTSYSCALGIIQVENALANIFTGEKQWRMALECLERIMEDSFGQFDLDGPVTPVNKNVSLLGLVCHEEINLTSAVNGRTDRVVLEAACCCELLSRQGRILMQVGAVDAAKEIYDKACATWEAVHHRQTKVDTTHDSVLLPFPVQILPIQFDINKALVAFSEAQYDEAEKLFQNAISSIRQAQNSSTQSTSTLIRTDDDDWIDHASSITSLLVKADDVSSFQRVLCSLYSECMNNVALCCLYTCRLSDAIQTLEALIRENPAEYVTERIVLNLCTLYELSADTTESTRKKQIIQCICQRFMLHDISVESFRLP